jgi:hypothetical protein
LPDSGFLKTYNFWRKCSQFAVCFTYFLSKQKTSSIERLSQHINIQTTMMSTLIAFWLRFHDETIHAVTSTEVIREKNKHVIKLNFLWDS